MAAMRNFMGFGFNTAVFVDFFEFCGVPDNSEIMLTSIDSQGNMHVEMGTITGKSPFQTVWQKISVEV